MTALLAAALLLGPKTELDVEYANIEGTSLQMDLYYPADWVQRPAPAMVVIHGGAWMGGKRQDMADIGIALARNGFVAASISYRLAPKFKYPAMIDDARTAVRYLRKNADRLGLDPRRIGATGASAGGHMSLLLGVTDSPGANPYPEYSSKVSAVLDLFGPTDMSQDYPPALDMVFQQVLGKKKADGAKEIFDASPVNFIDAQDAPIFAIHGDADPLVPIKQSYRLQDKAKQVGLPLILKIVPGMKHELPVQQRAVRDALGEGISFLKQVLR